MLFSPIQSGPHYIVVNSGKSKPKDETKEVKVEIKKDENIMKSVDQEDLNILELDLRVDYNDKFKKIENLINDSFNKLNDKIDIEVSKINMIFDKLDNKIDNKIDAVLKEISNVIKQVEDLVIKVGNDKKELDNKDQEMIVMRNEDYSKNMNSFSGLKTLINMVEANVKSLEKRVEILDNIPSMSNKIPNIIGIKRKKID